VLESENKNGRGYGTFACAGQAAGEREKVRSHNDVTLRGSGAGFNTNIQQNIGDEQAPKRAKFRPALCDNLVARQTAKRAGRSPKGGTPNSQIASVSKTQHGQFLWAVRAEHQDAFDVAGAAGAGDE